MKYLLSCATVGLLFLTGCGGGQATATKMEQPQPPSAPRKEPPSTTGELSDAQIKLQLELDAALRKGDLVAAQAALDKGADVNVTDDDGNALICSIANPHAYPRDLRAAKFLLENGANMEIEDRFGIAAAASAVWWERLELLKLFESHGAKLDVTIERYGSLLHLGVLQSRPHVCQYLIDSGIDVDLLNDDGESPLHLAADRGRLASVELLLKNGADLTLKDKDGKTALELAQENLDRTSDADTVNKTENQKVVDQLLAAVK